ncbi:guanylate-binding protein 1 [Mesocricetus auratus]|uniref:Guanylate-binding protein 1 n=1 Tax=Mesocricetus auratus TaxID=10036 RepID=A0A1U7R8T9_MESAU|nr:guanylate-binding protein 1 [Mesocricetus auratus]XP_040607619.1 guanylate-binding protein 1 [Mesocricetus auratus]XP_040607620.1 guanylate-binding protein 1 [Mesocricetus auratus]XP_040607621.1 guanylate-binding protein 1 [Mesocricetus auratus]XP_040607622.1 guanylate-binding protein 1 [Mesocricetus auratus]XP_040607623.1 guanylate-binding protein 1 [Mesocricetus auratus]XP_040607624.1 guanylate-binding protein 1 [Mesocricetus auratus]
MEMTSEINMPGPVCLIENSDQQLVANQKALEILSAIKQPMVVVAIVGFYRTGKSYLMNKLAGKQKGFSLGSTVQSHTKGIWVWCVPHPQKPGHTLVLLDTEGLEDVEKGDNQNDCWIFALSVLLSSTFIYNSMGAINQQAMDQLHYVTELTDLIKSKSSPEQSAVDDSANFVSFFPTFVWALRDFSLELKFNENSITPDEYLECSLALRQGTDKKTKRFNEPRLCIRKFFPERKCFVFDRPAQTKQLAKLETVPEGELNVEFVEQVAEFTSYIFSSSGVKTLSGGITVNGPRLQNLVLTYVNAIRSGELPCMENAVLTLAQIENAASVQKAIEHYEKQMNQKVQLPTETLQELLDLHRPIESEAIEVFIKNSFKDVDQKFQKELGEQLVEKRDAFIKKNMDVSSARCSDFLEDIFGPLEEEVKQGTFSKPGGYYLFLQRKQDLEKKYNQTPGKGLQAEETLKKYFESKEAMMDTLLKMDQSLTEKEKQIEGERIRAEAAEAANRELKEMQKKHELMMEEKERSYQEHVKQLTEKMQQEREELMAEQQKVIAHKLQEQERLLKEGFQNESRKLHQEIEKIKSSKAPSACTIF